MSGFKTIQEVRLTHQSTSNTIEMRLFSLSFLVVGSLQSVSATQNTTACRCLPTEPCWPSDAEWQSLNETVNGQLSRVLPLGAVCHDPTYDKEACGALLKSAAYDSSLRAATAGKFPCHLHHHQN